MIVEAHCATGSRSSARCSATQRRREPGRDRRCTGDGWYDYEAKYTPGGMELAVPARISRHGARARARARASRRSALAGCSGLARVDFFVDGEDVLLNELNTMPGFTQTSVYGKLWEASGRAVPRARRPALRAGASSATSASAPPVLSCAAPREERELGDLDLLLARRAAR